MKTATIIAIGNELLRGEKQDTNSAYLSTVLFALGLEVTHHLTVADDPTALAHTLDQYSTSHDVIITIGGLGPTHDDPTRDALELFTGKKMVRKKALIALLERHFAERNTPMPSCNLTQAYIPQGADFFINHLGTAPGIALCHKTCLIIALPGPPRELKPMMQQYVCTYLKKYFRLTAADVPKKALFRTAGIGESRLVDLVSDLITPTKTREFGLFAHGGTVDLVVVYRNTSQAAYKKHKSMLRRALKKRLGIQLYATTDTSLEETLAHLLKKHKLSLATAESCTGGRIASTLTRLSGASVFFKEGLITYANASKIKRLGVSSTLIKKHGVVSAAVVTAMAGGVRRKLGTDIGFGISGIAGPTGGSRTKPVGLIFAACMIGKQAIVEEWRLSGPRQVIQDRATVKAIDMMRRCVLEF